MIFERRLSFSDVPEVEPIFHRFREAVLSAGWREAQARPYGYGRFDNGVAITDAARASYRDLGVAAGRFGDPFRTEGAESFFHWLTGAAVV